MIPPGVSRYLYKSIAALALVGLFFVGKHFYDRSVVRRAELEASQARLVKQADSLRAVVKAADTRIAHDTVVLNRSITRYKAIRDTIVVTDTVQVKEALSRCDSVVSAAGPTIASLRAGIESRDATIFNRDSTIQVLNARFPSRATKAKYAVGGVVGGLILGAAIWAR